MAPDTTRDCSPERPSVTSPVAGSPQRQSATQRVAVLVPHPVAQDMETARGVLRRLEAALTGDERVADGPGFDQKQPYIYSDITPLQTRSHPWLTESRLLMLDIYGMKPNEEDFCFPFMTACTFQKAPGPVLERLHDSHWVSVHSMDNGLHFMTMQRLGDDPIQFCDYCINTHLYIPIPVNTFRVSIKSATTSYSGSLPSFANVHLCCHTQIRVTGGAIDFTIKGPDFNGHTTTRQLCLLPSNCSLILPPNYLIVKLQTKGRAEYTVQGFWVDRDFACAHMSFIVLDKERLHPFHTQCTLSVLAAIVEKHSPTQSVTEQLPPVRIGQFVRFLNYIPWFCVVGHSTHGLFMLEHCTNPNLHIWAIDLQQFKFEICVLGYRTEKKTGNEFIQWSNGAVALAPIYKTGDDYDSSVHLDDLRHILQFDLIPYPMKQHLLLYDTFSPTDFRITDNYMHLADSISKQFKIKTWPLPLRLIRPNEDELTICARVPSCYQYHQFTMLSEAMLRFRVVSVTDNHLTLLCREHYWHADAQCNRTPFGIELVFSWDDMHKFPFKVEWKYNVRVFKTMTFNMSVFDNKFPGTSPFVLADYFHPDIRKYIRNNPLSPIHDSEFLRVNGGFQHLTCAPLRPTRFAKRKFNGAD